MLLVLDAVLVQRIEHDLAEQHLLPIVRPLLRDVVGGVALLGELRVQQQLNRALLQAVCQLLELVVGALRLDLLVAQVRVAGRRLDLVAHELLAAIRRDELERVERVVRLGGEAGGEGLRRRHERGRRRVRRHVLAGLAAQYRGEELQEVVACPHREVRRRVPDDVRVLVLPVVHEAHCEAARDRVRVGVGDHRYAGAVAEAYYYRSRVMLEVWCLRESFGFGGGCEGSFHQLTFGVS